TGRMTENEMTVKEIFLNKKTLYVRGDGYDVTCDFFLENDRLSREYANLESLLLYGLLCNNAQLMIKKGRYTVDGDPNEGALLVSDLILGLSNYIFGKYKIVKVKP